MPRYETYRSNAAELPVMRKWIFRALVLSMLLHIGFFLFAYWKKIEDFTFTKPTTTALKPVQVVMQKVTIDPATLSKPDEERLALPDKLPNATIAIPAEKPEPKQFEFKPQNTEIAMPVLSDKPEPRPLNWELVEKTQALSAGNDDKQLGSIAASLLQESTRSANQPVLMIPPGAKAGGEGMGGDEGIPGRQSLEDALAGAGPAGPDAKPIAVRGGALFDHDSADLREEAIPHMQMIGELIKRNPDATFVISGHTDHTGTQEYNQRLSQRRADAVKNWLVQNLGIDESRIQTVGRGNAEALVPADKSIEEQQPNRRVEIVIKTRRG